MRIHNNTNELGPRPRVAPQPGGVVGVLAAVAEGTDATGLAALPSVRRDRSPAAAASARAVFALMRVWTSSIDLQRRQECIILVIGHRTDVLEPQAASLDPLHSRCSVRAKAGSRAPSVPWLGTSLCYCCYLCYVCLIFMCMCLLCSWLGTSYVQGVWRNGSASDSRSDGWEPLPAGLAPAGRLMLYCTIWYSTL